MQGKVSAVNRQRHSGHIQGDDGALLYFDAAAFLKKEDQADVTIGMTVTYDAEGDRAYNLELVDKEAFLRSERAYTEPPLFELRKSPFMEGYEVIDRGAYPILKVSRHFEEARGELIGDLKKLGANTGLNFKVTEETRPTMGYAFLYYHLSAFPAVCGKPDPKGEITQGELASRLDHKTIKSQGLKQQNVAIARLALKITLGLLIAVFTLGFFLTL